MPIFGDDTGSIHLVACGSFNPPTIMHLRMFEIARNTLGRERVTLGTMSPVADAYGKPGLAPASDRIAMCKLAIECSEWLEVGQWESSLGHWSTTRSIISHYRGEDAVKGFDRTILLAGSDMANALLNERIWDPQDVRALSEAPFGIVVVQRAGYPLNPELLCKYPAIVVCPLECENNISSTLVRRLISQGLSVKYLLNDRAIQYIHSHSLYRDPSPNKLQTHD